MLTDIPKPDPRPQWLIDKQEVGTGLNSLTVDGRAYPYTLVKPKIITPHLPYAVGFPSQAGLYISSDVPPEDLEHILAHEVRETIRFPGLLEEERCTAALAAELREVQLSRYPLDFKTYINRRTDYFNALLRHYQAPEKAAMVTPGYYDGLLTAGNYINHISAGLNKKR